MNQLGGLLTLAQLSVWESLGNRFTGQHRQLQTEDVLGLCLLLAGFGCGLWLLSRAQKWADSDHKPRAPRRVFNELASRHRLSYQERRACRAVASELGLADPAELFVRPEAYTPLASQNTALADRLFGPRDD